MQCARRRRTRRPAGRHGAVAQPATTGGAGPERRLLRRYRHATCSAAASPAEIASCGCSQNRTGSGRRDDERPARAGRSLSALVLVGASNRRSSRRSEISTACPAAGPVRSAASVSASANSIPSTSDRGIISVSPSTTGSCTTSPAGTSTSQRRPSRLNRGTSANGQQHRDDCGDQHPTTHWPVANRSGAATAAAAHERARNDHRREERRRRAQQESILVAVRRRLDAALTEFGAADQQCTRPSAQATNAAPAAGRAPAIQLTTDTQRATAAHIRVTVSPSVDGTIEGHHSHAPERATPRRSRWRAQRWTDRRARRRSTRSRRGRRPAKRLAGPTNR